VLVASVYLLTAAGRFANYDAERMFAVTRSLYERGSLDAGPCQAQAWSIGCVRGVDGRFYSGYGVVASVAAVPFFAAGIVAGRIAGVDPELASSASVSFMNSLVGALACVVLFLWAAQAGCTVRQSLLAAILLAFATPFWFHSTKEFYSEPLFTLFLLGSFAALSRGSRTTAIIAGVLFGLAVGTRVFGLIYLPIAGVYAVLVSPRRASAEISVASFFLSVLVCLAGVGAINQMRFGSPFNTGYHVAHPELSSVISMPVPTRFWQIFVRGEVGLLWFSPLILLLPLTWKRFHREHRAESFACIAIVVSSLVFFSGYADWHHGWAYGPRLLTPMLPFAIFPLTPLLLKTPASFSSRRIAARAALVLITVAIAIQVIGIIPPYSRQYYLRPYYYAQNPRPWWHTNLLLKNVEDLPQVMSHVSPRASQNEKDRYLQALPNSINQLAPDIWWLKAAALGKSWLIFVPAVLILALCAVAAAFRLRRVNA
jgi:4-amino-4-deoxy-L-arabinose transferase-like glycosyltransferase